MIETLHNASGQDSTRVKRAFGWVVTFRDFPAGSWQTVDSEGMIKDALTLFTKGRAEFYLDGVKRGDRLPGILSSEYEPFPPGGTFKLVYVEPTTRLCVPRDFNRGELPLVEKIQMGLDEMISSTPGDCFLVCLGEVNVKGRTFPEESTFKTVDSTHIISKAPSTILLRFKNARR